MDVAQAVQQPVGWSQYYITNCKGAQCKLQCMMCPDCLSRLCCDCTVVQSAKGTGAKAGDKQVQQQAAGGISKCQLSLPEQQQQVVQSFRRQVSVALVCYCSKA